MPDSPHTADIVERLESLIFMRDEDQTDHNAFISGFAYGRFSTLDSEMALHWFMRGADTPATCSIVGEPKSLLTPDPEAAAEIKALRQKLRMIISHASGGHLSEPEDVDRSVNDICVEISRHKNEIWKQAQESALKDHRKVRS